MSESIDQAKTHCILLFSTSQYWGRMEVNIEEIQLTFLVFFPFFFSFSCLFFGVALVSGFVLDLRGLR